MLRATHAAVVNFPSIRTFLTIAATEDLELQSIDVDTAFLNATLDEPIYLIKQPEGFAPSVGT